ncbi:ankyrin repeat-containing domain protein [Aspergillus germanicus]
MGVSQRLASLPTEIIHLIASYLEYEYELYALSQVNRDFHALLNQELYRTNVRKGRGESDALLWAAIHGLESTAVKAIAAGARVDPDLLPVAAAYGHLGIVALMYKHSRGAGRDLDRYVAMDTDLYVYIRIDRQIMGKPLTLAAKHGNESVVRFLLQHGADVDSKDHFGRTALANAAHTGHLSIVRILVDHGADLEDLDSHTKATPTEFAIRAGHTEIVRFLLESGAVVDCSSNNRSYLAIAAAAGHKETVQCLFDFEARPDIAMFRALASHPNLQILVLLKRRFDYPHAAKDTAEQSTVACAAAACGYTILLKEIIALGWDVNSPAVPEYDNGGVTSCTPLAVAAAFDQVAIVRLLLSHGALVDGIRSEKPRNPQDLATSMNTSLESPLVRAIMRGSPAIVSVLLDHGAKMTGKYTGRILLSFAIPHEPVFSLLIERGALADPSSAEAAESLAVDAVVRCRADPLRILIDRGVDLSDVACERHLYTWSWPHLLGSTNKAVVDVLVKHNFIPPTGSLTERETVNEAISQGNVPLLKHLLSRGIDLSHQFWLHELLTLIDDIQDPENAEAALDALLAQGLSIDILCRDRRTPLLSIFVKKRSSMGHAYRLLVERGANPCFRDPRGKCPLVAAVSNKKSPYGVVAPLLRGIKEQNIPFHVFAPQVFDAIRAADEDPTRLKDQRLLRQFYWRALYPV